MSSQLGLIQSSLCEKSYKYSCQPINVRNSRPANAPAEENKAALQVFAAQTIGRLDIRPPVTAYRESQMLETITSSGFKAHLTGRHLLTRV